MRRKLIALLTAFVLGLTSVGLASAQSTGYTTSFTTSITYQNAGTGPAQITLTYFSEANGTAVASTPLPVLAKGASSSVFVGSVSQVGPTFKGSGVLSSDQPIVATLVQLPAGTSAVKNRPLSNGFSEGTARVLLATVLKNKFNATSVFSVQNAGSAPVSFQVKIFNAEAPTNAPVVVPVTNLPAGSTKYFDMGTIAGLPAVLNGSAVVESTGGSLVATVMELSTTGIAVSAFEGIPSGANKVYMPSALCNAFGGQGTAYAVQNTGTASTSVKVTYSPSGKSETKTVAAGAKASFHGCGDTGTLNVAGFNGSATIQAGPGGSIVAIGKVGGTGISSAFLGAASGAPKLALPYVRFSLSNFDAGLKNRQRTNIAIQNIGATAIAANQVTVQYVNSAGVVVATHTLGAMAVGQKLNTNPYFNSSAATAEFGYSTPIGGGAIIQGPPGSQLVAVARVQSYTGTPGAIVTGEDYNGIPIQ